MSGSSSSTLPAAQLAAVYAHLAKQAAQQQVLTVSAVTPVVEDNWPDTDSEYGVFMLAEVSEVKPGEVWMLYDTGSAVTTCPREFMSELGEDLSRALDLRCEAATGGAVQFGGRREVPIDVGGSTCAFSVHDLERQEADRQC